MDCWMKLWIEITNSIKEIETARLEGVQLPLWQSKYHAELAYLYQQRSAVVNMIPEQVWLEYGHFDKYRNYHLHEVHVSKAKKGG